VNGKGDGGVSNGSAQKRKARMALVLSDESDSEDPIPSIAKSRKIEKVKESATLSKGKKLTTNGKEPAVNGKAATGGTGQVIPSRKSKATPIILSDESDAEDPMPFSSPT